MDPRTFIFIGRSGCGKGTQSKLLSDYLKSVDSREVCYLESGSAFREFIKGEGYSHDLSRAIYDKGGLQPEFISVWMWASLLINNLKGNEHLIVDGAARRYHECAVLDSAFDFYGRKMPFLVYITVSREWSRERLSARARIDDTKEDIERRLDWFDEFVVPAIGFFQDNPRYHFLEINGEQPIEAVHRELVEKMNAVLAHGSH